MQKLKKIFSQALLLSSFFYLLSASAKAQELLPKISRQGYYIGLGPRFNYVTVYGRDARSFHDLQGGGFGLHLGEILQNRFALGLNLSTDQQQNPKQTLMAISFLSEAHLLLKNNWSLGLGLGLGSLKAENKESGNKKTINVYEPCYRLTLIYDWFGDWFGNFQSSTTDSPIRLPRSGGLSLAPEFALQFVPQAKFNTITLTLGVKIRYFTGLPTYKLLDE